MSCKGADAVDADAVALPARDHVVASRMSGARESTPDHAPAALPAFDHVAPSRPGRVLDAGINAARRISVSVGERLSKPLANDRKYASSLISAESLCLFASYTIETFAAAAVAVTRLFLFRACPHGAPSGGGLRLAASNPGASSIDLAAPGEWKEPT